MTNPTQLIERLARSVELSVPYLEIASRTTHDGTGGEYKRLEANRRLELLTAALTAARAHLEQPTEPAPVSQFGSEEMQALILAKLAAPSTEVETVRFCYECGSIGEVPEGKRDCCPDGSHAKYVHPVIAEMAQGGFNAMLPSKPAQNDQEENDRLIKALAEIRGIFPTPEHGSPIEREWASAMADPESVPAYVKACVLRPVGDLTDEQIKAASLKAGMQEHYMDFHNGFIRFAHEILAAARSQPVLEPLTEAEIMALNKEHMLHQDGVTPSGLKRIIRAIEAAHGITQGGKV